MLRIELGSQKSSSLTRVASRNRTSSGHTGIANAVCWPALGLCIAGVTIGLLAVRESPGASDHMTSRVLRNGETAHLDCQPVKLMPDLVQPSGEADRESSELRLHVIAWFVGKMAGDEAPVEGPTRYCCHALEAIINSARRNDAAGGFQDHFHFERLWEVTFYGTRPLQLPADGGSSLPQLNGLEHFAQVTTHSGERRMEAGELCRAIFANGHSRQLTERTELAFWNVSSLSGKVLRVGSSATARLSWYQPIHGDLFVKEVGWLQSQFSPATFHRLFTAPRADKIEAYELAQVLPPDAGLQSYLSQCIFRQVNITDRSQTRQIEIVGSIPPEVVARVTPLGCWRTPL